MVQKDGGRLVSHESDVCRTVIDWILIGRSEGNVGVIRRIQAARLCSGSEVLGGDGVEFEENRLAWL